MQEYQEGQRLQGSDGNIYVVRNGVPVREGGQGRIIPTPQDPRQPLQIEGDRIDNARGQIGVQTDRVQADILGRTAGAQVQKAGAEATGASIDNRTRGLPPGFMWQDGPNGPAAVPIPGYVAPGDKPDGNRKVTPKAEAALRMLDLIDSESGLQGLYNSNYEGNGLGSVLEYTFGGLNQSEALSNITAQNQALLPYVKQFMRVPGEGANSDKDQAAYEALLVNPNARDSANQRRIQNMRDAALTALRVEGFDVSGYDPSDPSRRGASFGEVILGGRTGREGMLHNPFDLSTGVEVAASGSTTKRVQVPQAYQDEYTKWAMQHVRENGGRLDPQAYAAVRAQLDAKYADELAAVGYRPGAAEDYLANGQEIARAMAEGAQLKTEIPGYEREMTDMERFRNDAVNSPLGSAATNFADMFGAGAVTALAPEQMNALRAERPISSAIGQIGGAVAGTNAIGSVASRMAPGAFKRAGEALGKWAKPAGALAEDVAYSALHGQVTQGDPLTSAGYGALGSVLGQTAGRAIGATVGGVRRGAAQQALSDRGVNLTVGQNLKDGGFIGRNVNRIEEAAESIPGVGQVIRARRADSMRDFNRAAFDEALSPVGRTVPEVAEQGIEGAQQAVSDAYTNALGDVNLRGDEVWAAEMDAANNLAQTSRLSGDFDAIAKDDLKPLFRGPTMTGRQFQDALQVLGDNSRYYSDLARGKVGGAARDPQARPLADAFRQMGDATEGLANRQAPEVMPAYNSAKEAYRNTEVLRSAVDKAKAGTQTDEAGVFTPYQLSQAASQNARRFGNGQGTTRQPFFELSRAGQEVLPSSLPNSGTADRQLVAAGVSAVPILGSGVAAQQGWISPEAAAGIAATSALYTRGGSKVANKVLFNRREQFRKAGEIIREQNRISGAAALPLFLPTN